MVVDITRESYPTLWSLFALVTATMGQSVQTHRAVGYTPGRVAAIEGELALWPSHHVLVLAGVVDAPEFYHRLVRTDAGRLAHSILAMD